MAKKLPTRSEMDLNIAYTQACAHLGDLVVKMELMHTQRAEQIKKILKMTEEMSRLEAAKNEKN